MAPKRAPRATKVEPKTDEKVLVCDKIRDNVSDEEWEVYLQSRNDTKAKISEGKFRMSNKWVMLTYKCHLPKGDYREWFYETLRSKDEIEQLEMAHETGDKSHNYDHTHVVVVFKKPFITKDCRKFDYTHPHLNDGLVIHCNIQPITTIVHLRRSIEYLAKEDPDNFHLKRQEEKSSWEVISDLRECRDAEDLVKEMTINDTGVDPLRINAMLNLVDRLGKTARDEPKSFHPNEFKHPWQMRFKNMIKGKPTGRFVHWFVDPHEDGGCGKSSFARALWEHYPDQNVYINSSNPRSVGRVLKKSIDRYKMKYIRLLMLDIPRSRSGDVRGFESFNIYDMIEDLSNGLYVSDKYDSELLNWFPGHVIIFSNWYPKVCGKLSKERVLIHTINRDNPKDCDFSRKINMIKTSPGCTLEGCDEDDNIYEPFENEMDDGPPEFEEDFISI